MASVQVKPEPTDDPGVGVDVDAADNAENIDQRGYLQRLLSSTDSPELLEKGVGIGVRVLESLKKPLEAAGTGSPQASGSQWLKAINDLEALAKPTRTIVGVVGNTGAGKSSVISAVLDEERYVHCQHLQRPHVLRSTSSLFLRSSSNVLVFFFPL
jgi:ABC-type microcin C transport system duplicated ATPase subunit YejF